MHPHVQKNEAGKCDICGMSLSLQKKETHTSDMHRMSFSEEALALAEVSTVRLQRGPLRPVLRLEGRLALHEGKRQLLTTSYSGRIEALYLVTEGKYVRRGQRIARLYAPTLHSTQTELLQAAAAKQTQADWYMAVKQKLQDLGFSASQIAEIETKKQASPYVEVLAAHSGTLIRRLAEVGDHLPTGGSLYEVADLSRLWVYFEAQENDLPWLKPGMRLPLSVESAPRSPALWAEIEQISPILQKNTRTIEIQAIVQNKDGQLRPEMYVQSVSTLASVGEGLLLPRSAVLWTGKRSLVYVRESNDESDAVFALREVELGPRFGAHYLVNAGLEEGEEVAIEGALSIDASMQLAGKAHMMSPRSTEVNNQTQPSRASQENKATTPLEAQLEAYLALTEALVDSDEEAARIAAKAFRTQLQKSKQDKSYTSLNTKLLPLLVGIEEETLDKIREKYAEISELWVAALHEWGSPEGELYEIYCPMAQNNKGGRWLWKRKDVLNPYFGESMLKCGRVVKEVKQKK